MPIQTATNKKTGERVAFIDGAWYPIKQSATGPEGQKAYKVGNLWYIDEPKVQEAPAEEPAPEVSPLEQETSFGDVGRNLLASAFKIGPTAVKGLAELGSMVTGDAIDFGVAERMQKGMRAIDEVIGSEKFNAQQKAFAQIIADDTKSVGDMMAFLAENPAVLVDQGVTAIGSMFLPVGAAGAAAKGAKALKASEAAVRKATIATTIGTSAAQNAASTFAELEDKPLEDRYAGAAVTGAVSMLAGIATKGGAEGALARKLADDLSTGKVALSKVTQFLKGAGREAGQEVAEEVGGAAGEAVGGEAPSLTEVGKRAAVAGIIGGGLGAGVELLPSGRPEVPPPPPPARPTAEAAEAAPTLPPEQMEQVDKLMQLGIAEDDATRMIASQYEAELATAKAAEAPSAGAAAETTAVAAEIPEPTVREAKVRAQMEDLVANGYPPEQAQQMAEEYVRAQDEADIEAEVAAQEEVAREPVGAGVGVGAPVSEPAAVPPTTGAVEEPERGRVDGARPTLSQVIGAEGEQPPTLAPVTEAPVTEAPVIEAVEPTVDPYTDVVQKIRVGEIKPTVPAVQAALGVKTPAEARAALVRMKDEGVVVPKGKGYKLAPAPVAEAPVPAPTEVTAPPAEAVEAPAPAPTPAEEAPAPVEEAPAPVEETAPAARDAYGRLAEVFERPAPAQTPTTERDPYDILAEALERRFVLPTFEDVGEALGMAAPKKEDTPRLNAIFGELEKRGVISQKKPGVWKVNKDYTPEVGTLLTTAAKELDDIAKGRGRQGAAGQIRKENLVAQLYAVTQEWGGDARQVAQGLLSRQSISDAERARAKKLYSAKKAGAKKVGAPATSKFLSLRQQSPTPPITDRLTALQREIRELGRDYRKGDITADEFANLVRRYEDAVTVERAVGVRARGAANFRAKLREAVKNGELTKKEVALAEWFIQQNPMLLDDLGVALVTGAKDSAAGQYLPAEQVVLLLKNGTARTTIVHEIMHHLERMMPEKVQAALTQEWLRQFLRARETDKSPAAKEYFDALYNYHFGTHKDEAAKKAVGQSALQMLVDEKLDADKYYQYFNPSEFWTANGSNIVAGRYEAIQGSTLKRLKNWLREFAQRAKAAFGKESHTPIISALDSLAKADGKFQSSTLLAERVSSAKGAEYLAIGNRTPRQVQDAYDRAETIVEESKTGDEFREGTKLLEGLRDPALIGDEFRRAWDAASYTTRRVLLKGLTTDFLSDVAKKDIPELRNTLKLMQSADGMTKQLMAAGADISAMQQRAFKKDPTLRDKLAKFINEATLTEYDPTDPNNNFRIAPLDQQYAQLGVDGQRLFTTMRDYYAGMRAYRLQLINDMISQLPVNSQSQQALRLRLQDMMQRAANITPYFPLMRFGDYWVGVGVGTTRKYFKAESMAERDRIAEGYAKRQYPSLSAKEALDAAKQAKTIWTGSSESLYKDTDVFQKSQILPGVFQAIDATNFADPNAKAELEKVIRELYLDTLPEGDIRKNLMEREGVIGFSSDISRVFAQSTIQNATQLSKLKYSQQLRNSISQARESIQERDQLEPFVDEMEARVSEMLAPPNEGVAMKTAKIANRVAFVWYLSAASSALIQPTSILITGWPIISERYGAAKTTAEFTKNLAFWNNLGVSKTNADGTVSWKAPSLEHAKGLTPLQQRAVRAFMQRGTFQSTMAGEQYDYASVPTEQYDTKWSKFKRGLDITFGGLMHTTERLSREFLAFSVFNMEYDRALKENLAAGMPQAQASNAAFTAAIDQSIDMVNEALMDPAAFNRPLGMQSPVGRVLTMFKAFPLHVGTFLLLNFKRMLPLMNKEGKRQAAYKFFGTLGTLMVFTGFAGLPSAVIAMIEAAWSAMGDDDDELPDEMRNLSFKAWVRGAYIPYYLGDVNIAGYNFGDWADVIDRGVINKLTGYDVAGRAGLGDIIFRDPQQSATSKEGMTNLLIALFGPHVQLILRGADATDAFAIGDYQRAAELMAPAAIRNPLVAARYYNEGVKTPAGRQLAEPGALTPWELAGQAVGFRPDILAKHQDIAFMSTEAENKIKIEKQKIMQKLKFAARKQDQKKFQEAMQEADAFGRKYPQYALDTANINQAIDRQAKDILSSVGGVTLNEQNVVWMYKVLENSFSDLKKRNEAALKAARENLEASDAGE